MAGFDTAYATLTQHEGGWADDPLDRGGQTFMGIARRHHPDWSGWRRIDAAKRRKDFPASLAADRTLRRQVRQFYRRRYWEPLNGDALPSQALGTELLEAGVNLGLRRTVRFLQRSLNLLNRNERDYADIVVDGLLGEVTLGTLREHLRQEGSADCLRKLMNALQAHHYVQLMIDSPSQERFARGWLKRV